jgi:hypothetical protein
MARLINPLLQYDTFGKVASCRLESAVGGAAFVNTTAVLYPGFNGGSWITVNGRVYTVPTDGSLTWSSAAKSADTTYLIWCEVNSTGTLFLSDTTWTGTGYHAPSRTAGNVGVEVPANGSSSPNDDTKSLVGMVHTWSDKTFTTFGGLCTSWYCPHPKYISDGGGTNNIVTSSTVWQNIWDLMVADGQIVGYGLHGQPCLTFNGRGKISSFADIIVGTAGFVKSATANKGFGLCNSTYDNVPGSSFPFDSPSYGIGVNANDPVPGATSQQCQITEGYHEITPFGIAFPTAGVNTSFCVNANLWIAQY